MTKPAASTTEEFALCSAELVLGEDGKAPRELMLLPFGNPIPTRDGRGPFVLKDRAHAERVIAASEARLAGSDAVIDYDHQSALAATAGVGGRAPASGWMKGFEIRDDGIWAAPVEWTPAAEAAICAKEYRYHSPWFFVDRVTREVTWIKNAGLTNSPNLDLPALAHQQLGAPAGDVTDMKTIVLATTALAAALALKADDLDETKVLAAIEELKTGKDGSEAALASFRTELGLAADAGSESVLAAIQSAKQAGAPDPTKYVPKAGYDELNSRLKTVEDERVLASVDQAVADGKLPPSMKEWAISLGKKDEPALASYLAAAVPVIGKVDLPGAPKAKAATLTEEDVIACQMTGTSQEDFLAAKNEEIA